MKTIVKRKKVNNQSNRSITKKENVILTIEDYHKLIGEVEYYKRIIEELQDEVDAYEADKIKKTEYETIKFDINDYVSDRDRKISTKDLKKPTNLYKRKVSKSNK